MYNVEEFVRAVDMMLDSARKRHIVGGILISASLLFGGLAFTVLTIKDGNRASKRKKSDQETFSDF